MSKLYPPYIEGILPAFVKNNPFVITIPYSMNPSVSSADVKGYLLMIKTVSTSTTIGYTKSIGYSSTGTISFTIDSAIADLLNQGEYYKFQIAYIDLNDVIGYYSTVGVAKYCFPATLSITNLAQATDLGNTTNFLKSNIITGAYSLTDISEKVYSYSFNLYDEDGELIETSGELLHNVSNDSDSYNSSDSYNIKTTLKDNINYLIEYNVTTTNKLYISAREILKAQPSIGVYIDCNLIATNNIDNGYIQVDLNINKRINFGHFILLRAESTDSYLNWTQILNFDIKAGLGYISIWKDLAIEQGVTYLYAILEYNLYLIYSDKIYSDQVEAEFEDTFLFDGERLLNIKFNPEMSTFKENVLEQKLETIGGKYPFIFRNGNVKYKEFSLSGLISYNMDLEGLFMDGVKLGIIEDSYERSMTPEGLNIKNNLGYNTNLSNLNVNLERKFKLAVLDWLNNGEIKCLKTPTEGNYLIRLISVSSSPEKGLGRMLHDFSATAYEIEEYSLSNIIDLWYKDKIKLNLDKYKVFTETTISLKDKDKGNDIMPSRAIDGAKTVWFQDIMPGTHFTVTYRDINNSNKTISSSFIINNTGSLYLETTENERISNVKLENNKSNSYIVGLITFGYETTLNTSFEHITKIEATDIIGRPYSYLNEYDRGNILEDLNNCKDTLRKVYAVTFSKINSNINGRKLLSRLSIGTKINKEYYNYIIRYNSNLKEYFIVSTDGTYYRVIKSLSDVEDLDVNWYIITNEDIVNDNKKEFYTYLDKKNSLIYLDNLTNLKYIELGPNVRAEVSYELVTASYDIEETNSNLKQQNTTIKNAIKNLTDLSDPKGQVRINTLREKYSAYLNDLQKELEQLTIAEVASANVL